MSRSDEFKEQGFACHSSATDSQFGDLEASVLSPLERLREPPWTQRGDKAQYSSRKAGFAGSI
jgi:hypothetical protein